MCCIYYFTHVYSCSIGYGVVARPVKLEADHASFVITASQLITANGSPYWRKI